MTDRCERRIVVDEILVLGLVCPIYSIDAVRLVVAILHTLLVTVEFLTGKDERNTLRSVDCCLGEFHHCQTLSLSCICSFLKTVTQTVVIVTAHVADVLERAGSPTLYSHLRMLHTTGDTELYVLLVSFNAIHETCVLTAERATYCVADVIAECSDSVKHVCVCLECNLLCRIGWSHCCPTLTVEHHLRIDSMQTLADEVHGLDIVDSHEIKTEAIDMIFLHPPLE